MVKGSLHKALRGGCVPACLFIDEELRVECLMLCSWVRTRTGFECAIEPYEQT